MHEPVGNEAPASEAPAWLPTPDPGSVQLILVRHGRTAWNKERRFLGRTDVPLDAVGQQEAQRLARRLADARLDAIWTSPLHRATQTADVLATPHRRRSAPHELLVELSQGELEGQPGSVLPERYPDFLARWLEDPGTARVPGGETLSECQARGVEALHGIAAQAEPGQTLAVVSHQMVIASVLCHVLELPLRYFRLVGHDNAAFSVLGYRHGQLQLRRIHDRAHLDR